MFRQREKEWLDHVAALLLAPLPDWPDDATARLLCESFDAPACSYVTRSATHPPQGHQWPPEHFAGHLAEVRAFTLHEAATQHPLLRYYGATGDLRCMQVAEVPVRFADARVQARWRERGRGWGDVQSQLALPLSTTEVRSFVIGRADRFTAQEMGLARRLERLLTGLGRHLAAHARWSVRCAGGREVADDLRLTPREITVLDLLARGLTAAAIGRRLGIAERTVQKHLQHAYAKLGVADRLDAVLRARRIGLLS